MTELQSKKLRENAFASAISAPVTTTAMATAEQNQKPGAASGSPTWLRGPGTGAMLHAFPGSLAGSCSTSGTLAWAVTHMAWRCAGSSLTPYTTAPISPPPLISEPLILPVLRGTATGHAHTETPCCRGHVGHKVHVCVRSSTQWARGSVGEGLVRSAHVPWCGQHRHGTQTARTPSV